MSYQIPTSYAPHAVFTDAGQPPPHMAAFWGGSVFYTAPGFGIMDESYLSGVLGINPKNIGGDFTLLKIREARTFYTKGGYDRAMMSE